MQELSLSVASGLKLHDAGSVQPATGGAAKYNIITSSAVNARFQIPKSSRSPSNGAQCPFACTDIPNDIPEFPIVFI
jgi:hypothetical protein